MIRDHKEAKKDEVLCEFEQKVMELRARVMRYEFYK